MILIVVEVGTAVVAQAARSDLISFAPWIQEENGSRNDVHRRYGCTVYPGSF